MHASERLLSACSVTPLAACLVSALLPATPASAATTWTVNNCGDAVVGSGTSGSLRYAAANASSGDTVNIVCSAISLTTGAVVLGQTDITINGPAPQHAVIQAVSPPANGNILDHAGIGYLKVSYITAEYGSKSSATGSVYGGCIYSNGNLYLDHVSVYKCTAHSTAAAGYAFGGGVATKGSLTITSSLLSHNTASSDLHESVGGGTFAYAGLAMSKSTVEGNTATGAQGYGGGVYVSGNFTTVTISDSTVSGNTASFNSGGVSIYDATIANASTVSIINSTITGNYSGGRMGGVYVIAGTVKLISSTIANNTAKQETDPRFPNVLRGPGVEIFGDKTSSVVYLQSTLIANNTYGPSSIEDDFHTSVRNGSSNTVTFDASSANNLVRATLRTTMPGGTIAGVCPLLGPLRDNGGSTKTLALLSHSPGIEQGNNVTNLTFDQRGTPYVRVSGASADIGAYEVQQNDIVFDAGFEGCP